MWSSGDVEIESFKPRFEMMMVESFKPVFSVMSLF